LIEQIGLGVKINIVKNIPETYHPLLKKAIRKVNINSKPVWEIFMLPLLDPDRL